MQNMKNLYSIILVYIVLQPPSQHIHNLDVICIGVEEGVAGRHGHWTCTMLIKVEQFFFIADFLPSRNVKSAVDHIIQSSVLLKTSINTKNESLPYRHPDLRLVIQIYRLVYNNYSGSYSKFK